MHARKKLVLALGLGTLILCAAAPADAGSGKFAFANTALSSSQVNDLHFHLGYDEQLGSVGVATSAVAGTNEGSFGAVTGYNTNVVHVTNVGGVGKPGVLTLTIGTVGTGGPTISDPEWTKDGTGVGTPAVTKAK